MKSKFTLSALLFLLVVNPWIGLNAFWIPTVPSQVNNPAVPIAIFEPATFAVNPQGNAVATWSDENSPFFNRPAISSSFYTRGIGWSAPQIISSLQAYPNGAPYYLSQGDVDVALHSSNYAVAVWEGTYLNDEFDSPDLIISAVRNSDGVWQPIQFVSELNGELFAFNSAVQINSAGLALAAWRSTDLNTFKDETLINFLPYNGVWGTPFSISGGPEEGMGDIGDNFPRIAINARGDAVVTWFRRFPGNIYGIAVSTYNAGTATWSPQVTLDTATSQLDLNHSAYCAIDENGNSIALVRNMNDIKSYYHPFGDVWSAAVTISNNATEETPAVVMDPAGNATAVWAELSGNIYSSYLPLGGTWSLPQVISTGASNFFSAEATLDPLAVDAEGNVITIWENADEMPFAAFRPFGQAWQPGEQVSTLLSPFMNIGLASCGFAVALWTNDDGVFAAINANLLKPLSASYANGCRLRFATQSRYTSFLTWVPVSPDCIQSYRLYCNGLLIGESFSQTAFELVLPRCSRRDTCTYTITSVNTFGYESDPVPFVFNG